MQIPIEIVKAIVAIQGSMVDVVTRMKGPETYEELRYKELFGSIEAFYKNAKIDHKNIFNSLKEWRGYAMINLKTYKERREYVKSLYQSKDIELRNLQESEVNNVVQPQIESDPGKNKKEGKIDDKRAFYKHWFFQFVIGPLVVGIILIFIQHGCSKKERPHLSIKLTSNYLELYPERNTFAISYQLENGKDDPTAYNIKKGHMRFDLSDKKSRSCKAYYEPKNIVDVLLPNERSAAHKDDIGDLDHSKSYKVQLIITYTSSKDIKEKVYYSSAIFEIKPDFRKDKLFRVLQKSKDADEGLTDLKAITNSIDSCNVFL